MVKAFGTATMHHTCGSVPGLIPDMIDCGLDVLQSVQQDATDMSFADLERLFGDKICFQGGVSIQKTMPFGTPDSVTEAVANIASVARDHNNYIFCTAHNIQADTPVANITALMEAYQLHGRF
jgi:uroporphyrinogen decarboxylase